MKVKLATQLLSRAVADALKFCKYNLSLHAFFGVDATAKFIEIFNDVFDILNTRSCIEKKSYLSRKFYGYL